MKKKFLIIQIDGLGYDVFKKALENGYLPFLKSLLKEKRFFLKKLNCGLPATTSHFQSEIMYGESKNIPGMMWYDKKESKFVSCLTPQAKEVEESKKKKGILEKGVSIGNIFNGGAEITFTLSSFFGLSSPYFPKRISLFLTFLLPFLVIFDFFYSLVFKKRKGAFLEIFLGENLIRREIVKLTEKFAKEKKNIYVNFVGYDARAHLFGRENKISLKVLKKIDKIIEKIYWSFKKNYYFFLLSDHGQVDCVSFKQIFKKDLEKFIKERFKKEEILSTEKIKKALIFKAITEAKERFIKSSFLKKIYKIVLKIFKNYYKSISFEKLPYFFSEKGILVINQGDISQIYFLKKKKKVFFEEIIKEYPDLLETISNCWAVDFLVALTQNGKVKILGERKLTSQEKRWISFLIKMENSGDLILFGKKIGDKIIDFSKGKLTCHRGIEKEEQEIFVISPVKFKKEIEKVRFPKDLYKFFSGWK